MTFIEIRALLAYRRILIDQPDADIRSLASVLLADPFQPLQSAGTQFPAAVSSLQRATAEILGLFKSDAERSRARRYVTRHLKLLANGDFQAPKVVVFIHGIFSTVARAFSEMLVHFDSDPNLQDFMVAGFDYDFHGDMRDNARRLREQVNYAFGGSDVTLICHSMGGLIARLALLLGGTDCVRCLFLIGTPNFGALRTAQLGLFAQMAMASGRLLYGVFRRPGVLDLTRVDQVFAEPIRQGAHYADKVEYITIPGLFFHESRRKWELGSELGVWKVLFQAWDITLPFFAVWSQCLVVMERPHDGIVEERSNSLVPSGAGRRSEKHGAITNPELFGRTYMHVEHASCEDLNHVTVQQSEQIFGIVKSLILANSLDDWYGGLTLASARDLRVTFG